MNGRTRDLRALERALELNSERIERDASQFVPLLHNAVVGRVDRASRLQTNLETATERFGGPWLQMHERPPGYDSALRRKFEHPSQIRCLAFSPDGRTLTVGLADGSIWLWDWKQGKCLEHAPMRHESSVTCMAFSSDGLRLASGSSDHTVRLWDARSGAALGHAPIRHEHWVTCVAFSPDGRWLISCGLDLRLKVWSLPRVTLFSELPLETLVRAVHFASSDCLHLACDGHQLHSLAVLDFRVRNMGTTGQFRPQI